LEAKKVSFGGFSLGGQTTPLSEDLIPSDCDIACKVWPVPGSLHAGEPLTFLHHVGLVEAIGIASWDRGECGMNAVDLTAEYKTYLNPSSAYEDDI
jgi:hypothetical protein